MASSVKNMKRKVKVSTYKNSWLLECNGNDRPLAEKEVNVRWCLQHGADVNVVNSSGCTPLHDATRRSEPSIVYLLVKHNADPNVVDSSGETPMHLAVRNGDGTDDILVPVAPEDSGQRREDDTPQLESTYQTVRIVDMLVDRANLNLTDSFGDTPLHVAVRSGEASVATLLLEHGAHAHVKNSAGDTPLHLAAHRGEAPIIKALLSRVASVNIVNNTDNTPLHFAAHRGEVSVVEMLLKSGSVVQVANSEGDTPLHLAARNGKMKVVRLLLERGADAKVTNDVGFSPLHVAADVGNEDIVDLLLKYNADANAINNDGNTPLHLAVLKGHSSAVKLLLNRGVDVNVTNSAGDTSLYLAVVHGEPAIVELLLDCDADANIMSTAGNTPLHVAAYLGKSLVVDLLLNFNVDVNKMDSTGNTALHLAARRQHAHVVRLLLRHKADTTIRNSDWNTPLTVARIFHYEGNEEIISLLQNAEKESDPNAPHKEDRLVPFTDIYQSDNQLAIPDNLQIDTLVDDLKTDTPLKLHARKADTSGLSGQLYETKLLSLVLIRAINDEEIEDFYLGTNISNVGDMDDICLRYRVKGKNRPIMLFVQAKHREDRDKSSVTVIDVQSASGDYSLRKYFDSYLKIRDRFQTSTKEAKDPEEPKDPKELKDASKPKNLKELKKPKELKDSKDCKEPKDPKEPGNPKGSKEPKNPRKPKNPKKPNDYDYELMDSKEPKDFKESDDPKKRIEPKDPKELEDLKEHKDSKDHKESEKLKGIKETNKLNEYKEHKDPKESEDPKGPKEPKDPKKHKNSNELKDPKKLKDPKEPKEPEDPKKHMEFKDSKKPKNPKESKDFKEHKNPKNHNESKKPKEIKKPKELKDSKENKDPKELKDPMFEGNFSDVECNLIIYTPAKDCFTRKNIDQEVSEKVHYLINTSEKRPTDTENKIEVFQYKYEKCDIENLNKMSVIERLKKSGADFLEKILSKNTDIILVDKLIMKFHVIIGREVLQPCIYVIEEENKDYRMWEFRPQFFDSNIDYMLALKTTFVRVVSRKRSDQSNITDEDRYNCEEILKNPCAATISKVIGKLVSYNDKTNKLQLIEVAAFKKKIKTEAFKTLLKQFSEIETDENIINEAVKLKLESMRIKLPLSFGNLDMTFRGTPDRVQKRMKAVAEKLATLLKDNGSALELYIEDADVGPGKNVEKGFVDINGGIGSAVGNLLVIDSETNLLKIVLESEALPINAALFLKELLTELNKEEYELVKEKLSEYRIQIDVDGFPKDFLIGDAYGEKLAREYLSKLWFYTDQAKQDEVEQIVKDEIDKYYNNEKDSQIKFKIHSNAIFRSAHGEVEKWWKLNVEANYLTRDNDFYQKAKLDCFNNLLLTVMNHIYESKIYNVNFKFNPRIQQNNECIEASAALDIVFGQQFKIFDRQSKRINTDSGKKIKDLVQYAEKLANYYVAASCDPHMMENVLEHPDRQGDIVINILQNNVEHEYEVNEFKYSKRTGTSAMSGQLYKTKLLCLVLIRALNNDQIEDFFLGTNIRDIDDMDDICLRFRIKDQDKPVALFLQAKHKDDGKFSIEDVLKDTGGFSLRKYFKSYLNIRNRFQTNNEDTLFLGNVDVIDWNFVVYTPAKDNFEDEKKETGQKINEKLHFLITTNKNVKENFQYKYNKSDIETLTKVIVLERLRKLGADFLEFILFEKYENEMIAQYHVLMAQKVLQPCKIQEIDGKHRWWEFRPEFFKEDCDYLIALKETFFDKLKNTCWDRFRITDEDRDNFTLVLEQQNASTVSKLIGKLAVYNERSKKLQLVADFKTELMSNDKVRTLADKFNEIEIDENVIVEAIQLKLQAMKFKLPISFGNLDMTFPESDSTEKKIREMAEVLIKLLELNEDTKVIDFNKIMGTEEIEQDTKDIYQCIKTAFGNLLVLDPDNKMLKFNSNIEVFQENATLFLNELNKDKFKPINEKIHSFHIKVNVNEFPRDTFDGDEHDINQASDFLKNMWFYVNQAKEDEVEFTLKDEINRYYSNIGQNCSAYYGNLPEHIFLSSHEDIQKWWMQTSESPYLTRASELFERAKETEIANLLETMINFMFISNTSSVDIKFKQGVSKYFKFVKMHQIFNRMTSTLFCLFDQNFQDSINIELPEISEPAPYTNYSSLGELVFSLEIHHGMEWVAMKMWAISTYTQYFLLAKGGPDLKGRRARDGFLLQQLCNGRFGHLIEGEKDLDDFYSFVTTKFT